MGMRYMYDNTSKKKGRGMMKRASKEEEDEKHPDRHITIKVETVPIFQIKEIIIAVPEEIDFIPAVLQLTDFMKMKIMLEDILDHAHIHVLPGMSETNSQDSFILSYRYV